jgi:urease accessory protein
VNDVVAPRNAITAAASGWEARLALSYAYCGQRTIVERREHHGPLVVQKPFYPEGETVCQSIIVHPPGGIVGGDRLLLDVQVGEKARAQLTTPGAAKWYRSTGATAQQILRSSGARGSLLEWLPQESIVFDGAIAELVTDVTLSGDAVFLGWDIICLGRRLAGERWTQGRLRHDIVLRRDGLRQWTERALIDGGSDLLRARIGLDTRTVLGTFFASAMHVREDLVATCRAIECEEGEGAVTHLPGVLLARYRGESSEAARKYFTALWTCARPALAKLSAVPPRIWST